MDESQLKTLLVVALVVAFFVYYRRYLHGICSADSRMNRRGVDAARSAGVLLAIFTCLATLAVAWVCWQMPVNQGLTPWIIGVTAMLGAIWAQNAMTWAARNA
ncbi:hypothetical protein [Arthrobacter sp. GMC3]|uniref:hypothetical protein n=1 Tax=Arthrobacter sp. GMC3 TaxID=2058894 RepID=UPI000CE377E3|nr:hypothetical protein [Arthrobacter sp. GMC3]